MPRSPTETLSTTCKTLRIGAPATVPGFATSRMAYVQEPHRLDYFARHEWVDTPASMIAALVEERLDEAGLFAAVISGSSDVRVDLRLDMEIQQLVQHFESGNNEYVLQVKAALIDVTERALLSVRTFRYEETANEPNPVAGVAAANRAVDRFLADLVEFLGNTHETFDCPLAD